MYFHWFSTGCAVSPVWTSTAADRRRVRFEDFPDQGEKMDSEMIKGQNDSTENKDNPEMNEKLNGMNDEPSKWQENEVVFAKSSKAILHGQRQ